MTVVAAVLGCYRCSLSGVRTMCGIAASKCATRRCARGRSHGVWLPRATAHGQSCSLRDRVVVWTVGHELDFGCDDQPPTTRAHPPRRGRGGSARLSRTLPGPGLATPAAVVTGTREALALHSHDASLAQATVRLKGLCELVERLGELLAAYGGAGAPQIHGGPQRG